MDWEIQRLDHQATGIPQDSILRPILLHIFINDWYFWISKTNLLNFAGKGTISAAKNTIKKPILTLEKDSQAAIDWFNIHKMIVNPDKFQVIVLKKGFAE